MADTWIDELIPLPRPEYAKQTESMLTDLIWRSKGSSLSVSPTGRSYLAELAAAKKERLVPQRVHKGTYGDIVETMPGAENADVSSVISTPAGSEPPTRALLNSIVAPRSSGDRSLACVPISPDTVVLQTLHGLVNKKDPPNMANAIEVLGRLGGSDGEGHVASLLLQAFSARANAKDGLAGLVDTMFPVIAEQAWEHLKSQVAVGALPDWLGVRPEPIEPADSALLASHDLTPFKWFWSKWRVLCDPANGWYDALPARRFVDWALCLLRTGLAFAYLWEAEFFVRLYECIVDLDDAPPGTQANVARLQSMLSEDLVLATIESTLVPASQKHAWPALKILLARGYLARENFKSQLQDTQFTVPTGRTFIEVVEEWVNSLGRAEVEALAMPLVVKDYTANNQREFVRYLLRPRASDDDTADQADFYYLAQIRSNKFWFQPGPEWLVVVTSLLSKQPGGLCTLGMLLNDMRALGIKVDRWVLVGMLEESGLSTDSPDADDAIVIRASF